MHDYVDNLEFCPATQTGGQAIEKPGFVLRTTPGLSLCVREVLDYVTLPKGNKKPGSALARLPGNCLDLLRRCRLAALKLGLLCIVHFPGFQDHLLCIQALSNLVGTRK